MGPHIEWIYWVSILLTTAAKAKYNGNAGFNSVNLKGLGNNSVLSSDGWTEQVRKNIGNHPVFSFMGQRCGGIQTVTSWNQWSPELISTGKSPTELTQPESAPVWKQFIFWLQVSIIAMQHFTCALLFGFSSVYLVPSGQQRTGFCLGSSTFLLSLRHKLLSSLEHKSYSHRSLIVRRQNKLLNTWTHDPRTRHTQPMQIWVKEN